MSDLQRLQQESFDAYQEYSLRIMAKKIELELDESLIATPEVKLWSF